MKTSYGETSGFSLVTSQELELVNGGKGGTSGGYIDTEYTGNVKSDNPYTPDGYKAPEVKNGVSLYGRGNPIEGGVQIIDGDNNGRVIVNAGLTATFQREEPYLKSAGMVFGVKIFFR